MFPDLPGLVTGGSVDDERQTGSQPCMAAVGCIPVSSGSPLKAESGQRRCKVQVR